MNSTESKVTPQQYQQQLKELEIRLDQANRHYHRCIGDTMERWMSKEKGYEDVTKFCID